MHISKCQGDIQGALKGGTNSFKNDFLLQEGEKPTYKPEPTVEHDLLPKTKMTLTESEEMITLEIQRCVDEVIVKRLTERMTRMISWVLSESFQDELDTHTIMANIVDSSLARPIKWEVLDIHLEPLASIM